MAEEEQARAPGVMGLYADSLTSQKKKAQERISSVLTRSFQDEVDEPAPSPSVVKIKADVGDVIQSIDPDKVTPWDFADRPDSEFGDLTKLADSIRINGQSIAVLVRPGKDKGRFELIYGRRRWMACRDLGIPLKAIVKVMDDKEAFKQQVVENGERENVSNWAKAVSYKRAIDKGIYKNDAALAAHLGIHRATLSNIMAFNRIPAEIIQSIGPDKMANVSVEVAKTLSTLEDNEIAIAVKLGPKIASGLAGISLKNAVKQASAEAHASKTVTDAQNVRMFSYRTTTRGVTEVSFTVEAIKKYSQEDLIAKIAEILR